MPYSPLPAPPVSTARPRLFDEIAEALLGRIRSGELKPGDRLPPERRLVEEFGASRTAVREALRALAARGLVESHVGRGTFVHRPTARHLSDKLRLVFADSVSADDVRAARAWLEGELAARAAGADEVRRTGLAAAAGRRDEGYFTALSETAGLGLFGPILCALATLEGDAGHPHRPGPVGDALRAADADAARDAVVAGATRPAAPARR